MSAYHIPILADEVVKGLKPSQDKVIIDATAGGGGHTEAILRDGAKVLAIDADIDAIHECQKRFKDIGIGSLTIIQGNFRNIEQIAKANGFEKVDGILFDLGVSSHQLDEPGRGFSYRFKDEDIDLRLNNQTGISAKELLRESDEEELYEIFSTYGEENNSRAIAHIIYSTRTVKPIRKTGDLVEIVNKVSTDEGTLSRVFQALRIAVNDEISALQQGLSGAIALLKPKGRLVVLTFHSLEDRIVKMTIRKDTRLIGITKKPITVERSEYLTNKRSRSAKLRIAEKR